MTTEGKEKRERIQRNNVRVVKLVIPTHLWVG